MFYGMLISKSYHKCRSRSGCSGFGWNTFFGDLMKFIVDIFKNCAHTLRMPLTAGPLQSSFYSPGYICTTGYNVASFQGHSQISPCSCGENRFFSIAAR